MSENKFVTRAELKEVLAEFADRIIRHFEPRFDKIDQRQEKAESQLGDLQKQMGDQQKQMSELQNQIAELRTRLERVESGFVDLLKRHGRVEAQLNDLRNEIILLKDRVNRVGTGVERVVLGMFNLQNEDDLINGHLAKHQMDLDELKRRVDLVENEFSDFKSRYQAGASA
jgi:chromosome segregation ATPase